MTALRAFVGPMGSSTQVWRTGKHLAEGSHFAHVDALDGFLPPVLEFLA
jgi:hypothetical protein